MLWQRKATESKEKCQMVILSTPESLLKRTLRKSELPRGNLETIPYSQTSYFITNWEQWMDFSKQSH